MQTDALPTHLSRRQRDEVWGNIDVIPDLLQTIPGWVWGTGAVGAAGTAGASQLPDLNTLTTISPQSQQEGQPLLGINVPGTTDTATVPATQPPEEQSFYGTPKPVGDPTSDVKVPVEQPDLGTVWYPKGRIRDPTSDE